MTTKKKRPEKRPMPCCGALVDSVEVIGKDEAVPKEGDASVCFECGTWGRFVAPCGPADLRLFTADDLLDPGFSDDQLNMMRAATALVRAVRARRHTR